MVLYRSKVRKAEAMSGQNHGEVYVAKLFVHARAEDACEASDVNGQG